MKLLKDQRGAGLPEYGLLIALIAVISIAGILLVGQNVVRAWQAIFGG